MGNVQFRIRIFNPQAFSPLHSKDSRSVATTIVFHNIYLLWVRGCCDWCGLNEDDNICQSSTGVDQVNLIGQGFAAIVLSFVTLIDASFGGASLNLTSPLIDPALASLSRARNTTPVRQLLNSRLLMA